MRFNPLSFPTKLVKCPRQHHEAARSQHENHHPSTPPGPRQPHSSSPLRPHPHHQPQKQPGRQRQPWLPPHRHIRTPQQPRLRRHAHRRRRLRRHRRLVPGRLPARGELHLRRRLLPLPAVHQHQQRQRPRAGPGPRRAARPLRRRAPPRRGRERPRDGRRQCHVRGWHHHERARAGGSVLGLAVSVWRRCYFPVLPDKRRRRLQPLDDIPDPGVAGQHARADGAPAAECDVGRDR